MGARAPAICLVQLHKIAEPALVPFQVLDILSLLLGSVAKGIASRLDTTLERKTELTGACRLEKHVGFMKKEVGISGNVFQE